MMWFPAARSIWLDRRRTAVRALALASGVSLLAFHGRVFVAQLADGRLGNPGLMVRWLAAVGLVAALAFIQRRGKSLWSREALAAWLVAAMLHGPAMTPAAGDAINALAFPETVATTMLASLALVTASIVGLWMLAGVLAQRRTAQGHLYDVAVAAIAPRHMFGSGFLPTYFSRPPPHAV